MLTAYRATAGGRFAIRIGSSRASLAAYGLALLAALLLAPAAIAFDPDRLGERDRAKIAEVLEYAQTNAPQTLPESGASIAVLRTETRPRICRYFTLRGGGFGRQSGIGCRRAALDWDLEPIDRTIPAAPTVPIATRERPERTDEPPTPGPATIQPSTVQPSTIDPVIAQGPAVAPAPATAMAAVQPAGQPAGQAAGQATTPSAPLPERRPGTGIPLAAAPAAVRDYPAPPGLPAQRDAVAAAPPHASLAVFVANSRPGETESLFTLLESRLPEAREAEVPESVPAVPPPPALPDVRGAAAASGGADTPPAAGREASPDDDPAQSAVVGGDAADDPDSDRAENRAEDRAENRAEDRARSEAEGDLVVPLEGDRMATLPLPRRRPLTLAEIGSSPAVPRPAHKP